MTDTHYKPICGDRPDKSGVRDGDNATKILKTLPCRVSVVLYCTQKEEKYIKQAIDCCLTQTYRNLELIVVDDAGYSEIQWDKKSALFARYSDDPRFLLIRNKKSRGLGYALNQGFRMAHGKYLTWIRASHLLHEDAFLRLLVSFERFPKTHFVYSDYILVQPDSNETHCIQAPNTMDFHAVDEMSPCFMYTRDLYEAIGGYRFAFGAAADIDYWINVLEKYRMMRCPETLCSRIDDPYFMPRVERMRRLLYRRFILYHKRYISLESLESGVKAFKKRLRKHAKDRKEYFFLLNKSVFEMMRVSFRSGILYLTVLTYVDHRDMLNLDAARKRLNKRRKTDAKLVHLGAAMRRVSIVVYSGGGGEKYLDHALECCLRQTYPFVEVIVIDDGSKTEEKSYKKTKIFRKHKKDPRFFVIRNKRSAGLGRSLNQGFDRASGRYRTWIRDIHFLDPGAVEKMVRYLDDNPDSPFVYCDYWTLDPESGKKRLNKMPDYIDYNRVDRFSPCFLYKKDLGREVGRYRNVYDSAADIDYWLRIIQRHAMRYYPEPLCAHADVSYYGSRIDRIYRLLLRKFLLYRGGYITRESLQAAILRFRQRLEAHAQSRMEYHALLTRSIWKMFLVSPRTGLLFSALLIYISNPEAWDSLSKPLLAWNKSLRMFVLEWSLVRNKNADNVLCLIPKVVLGGAEKVIKDIVQQLSVHGYCFHLLAFKGENHFWCRQFLRIFDNTVLMKKGFSPDSFTFDEEYYRYLKLLVNRLNIRIIMISNAKTSYACLEKLREDFPDVCLIDILHSEASPAFHHDVRRVAPLIDRRVCISRRLGIWLRRDYETRGRAHLASRINVIHNANDMEYFQNKRAITGMFKSRLQLDQDAKLIAFIGRLAAEKRPLVFLDVARKILKECPEDKYSFVIAGEGYQRKVVEDRIRHLGLQEKVMLLGMVRPEAVRDILQDSYAVMITSLNEGLPLVAVESMAMKVPVICTDVGAVREVIKDGVNGFVVPADEKVVESFVSCIHKLVRDPDTRRSIAENCRSSVMEEYSLDNFRRRYRELLDGLLAGDKEAKAAGDDEEERS